MANYAVLVENVVVNLIAAENLQTAMTVTDKLCVEYTEENQAHIGLGYNPETKIFEQPVEEKIEKDLRYKV
jgi:hypothetical protein